MTLEFSVFLDAFRKTVHQYFMLLNSLYSMATIP